MANICKRYVDAIYDGDKYASSLEELAKLYTQSDFKNLMDNPMIKKEEKMSVIKEIIKQDDVFYNFISLLLHEKRFCLIENIYKEYVQEYNQEKGILTINIISADEISKGELEEIVQKFKQLYKASTVKYDIKMDKSLISGIKVNVCGKVYDSSVKTKLNNILN